MLLPVDAVLPELLAAFETHCAAVLQAPPGAGKTTRVPPALLDATWRGDQRVVMLEPRRLAARAAARWMSRSLSQEVGGTVGYRIHRETRVGPATRIEVVTEGILTRLVLADPTLEGIACVIFDEFHERSTHGDLGLALVLETQRVLRPDLRILVMSATLDPGPISRLLGEAPVISSAGRSHPVETRYLPPPADTPVETAVANAVQRAVAEEDGGVLAFLPGAGEIRRTRERLDLPGSVEVLALHGGLSQEEQDLAVMPSPPGKRKVVLATSIAETSLTLAGIRVVIDGGWSRVPKYSPRSGMTRLATVRVARSSADQRRGRAGREGPGVCYRLWHQAEDRTLLTQPTPEILEADLAQPALSLAAAGVRDPGELPWLDPPPGAAMAEARRLLGKLGALDREGRITPHGLAMSRLGTHPRLAHLLLRGKQLGAGTTAASLVALLDDRDVLRGEAGPPDPDISLRLELVQGQSSAVSHRGQLVDRERLRRVRMEAAEWRKAAGGGRDIGNVSPGVLLALAYPDRIAKRREGQAGRFLLENGQGAGLDAPSMALADYLVAADLDGDRRQGRIYLAAAITLEEIQTHFRDLMETTQRVEWDEASEVIIAREQVRLGALVLNDAPLRSVDPGRVRDIWVERLRKDGIGLLPWTHSAVRLRQRLAFLHRLDSAWPDVSDEALLSGIEGWLGGELAQARRRSDLERIDLGARLLDRLQWPQRKALDELAPADMLVPSGSRIPIDYSDPTAPVLAVRLQELFGLRQSPAVAGGRASLVIHLLSPAGRPVQVTRDLASFWRTTYAEVRKDLKGRYPKHYWPEDPHTAEPTRGSKRRKG